MIYSQPTYEVLKVQVLFQHISSLVYSQPTYEVLKDDDEGEEIPIIEIPSLPMRY